MMVRPVSSRQTHIWQREGKRSLLSAKEALRFCSELHVPPLPSCAREKRAYFLAAHLHSAPYSIVPLWGGRALEAWSARKGHWCTDSTACFS